MRQILCQSKERDQVLDIPRASVIALSDDPTTDDDSFSFCDADDLSGSSPPISFGGESGVGHAKTGMARFGVSQSARVVDFKGSAILDGRADKRVFKMEWESGQGKG